MILNITRTEHLLIHQALDALQKSRELLGQHKQNAALFTLREKLRHQTLQSFTKIV